MWILMIALAGAPMEPIALGVFESPKVCSEVAARLASHPTNEQEQARFGCVEVTEV